MSLIQALINGTIVIPSRDNELPEPIEDEDVHPEKVQEIYDRMLQERREKIIPSADAVLLEPSTDKTELPSAYTLDVWKAACNEVKMKEAEKEKEVLIFKNGYRDMDTVDKSRTYAPLFSDATTQAAESKEQPIEESQAFVKLLDLNDLIDKRLKTLLRDFLMESSLG